VPHTSPATRLLTLVVATVLAAGSVLSLAVPAQAAPKAAFKFSKAIDPLPKYAGQSKCSPTAKPGTSALSKMLLSTYKGSRSLGIVRACKIGGTSEHKEGRAFDWGLSAYSARDRGYANDFTKWALATDKYGNKYANARRLGIQYMIWNKRIWSVSYASSGWRKYTGASPHTDHVHISLSWNGANKKTSFWTGKVAGVTSKPAPAPVKAPVKSPAPPAAPAAPKTLPTGPTLNDETVQLDTKSTTGTSTKGALVKGQKYLVEAGGTYRYGSSSAAVADAQCSTAGKSSWAAQRSVHAKAPKTSDHLNVYLNGAKFAGTADTNTGQNCNTTDHVYRWVHTATVSGRAQLRLWEPGSFKDNSGSLTLRIIRYVAKDDMTWTVPATSSSGVTSQGVIQAGQDYVATISGTWQTGGFTADAECSTSANETAWRRNRVVNAKVGDPLEVFVDKRDVGGLPVVPTLGGENCNAADHVYQYAFKADATRTMNVRVGKLTTYAANKGSVTVRVRKVKPLTGRENLTLDTAKDQGITTTRVYKAGTPVLLRVSGSYTLTDRYQADAECTTTRRDRTWRISRADLVAGQRPLGDVSVDGQTPTWRLPDGGYGCNASDHEYTLRYVPARTGVIHLGVADTDFSDNSGTLTLTVEQTK
jgi:hypothetical protein